MLGITRGSLNQILKTVGIGNGQSWQSVSISNNVTYTNNTDKAQFFNVTVSGTPYYGYFQLLCYINNVSFSIIKGSAQVQFLFGTGSVIIPPHSSYKFVCTKCTIQQVKALK